MEVRDQARADALTIGRFEPNLLDAADETGPGVLFPGGNYEWFVYGTWDGATAQLQQSPDMGVTWVDFNYITATANGRFSGIPVARSKIRVKITSAGAATSLTSTFVRIN